jgi:hypothetical protein
MRISVKNNYEVDKLHWHYSDNFKILVLWIFLQLRFIETQVYAAAIYVSAGPKCNFKCCLSHANGGLVQKSKHEELSRLGLARWALSVLDSST